MWHLYVHSCGEGNETHRDKVIDLINIARVKELKQASGQRELFYQLFND